MSPLGHYLQFDSEIIDSTELSSDSNVLAYVKNGDSSLSGHVAKKNPASCAALKTHLILK